MSKPLSFCSRRAFFLALLIIAQSAQAGPLVLQHRWQFEGGAATVAFPDALAPADTARAALVRGTGAVAGGGAVSLPGGSADSAAYIDLPNGLLSQRAGDVTVEGWVQIGAMQSGARIFDLGSSTMGEVTAPGGTGISLEGLFLGSQVNGVPTTHRLSLLENGILAQGDAAVSWSVGGPSHFAVVYDTDGNNGLPQLMYYFNGAQVAKLNSSRFLKDIADTNNWLGRSNASADSNLQAAWNEFRIWDGAMFPDEVADSAAKFESGQLPDPLRIETFAAANVSIYSGQSTQLSWQISGAAGVPVTTLDQGIGSVSGSSGSVSVTPLTTTTYSLTTASGGVTRSAPLTVTVLNPALTASHATFSTPMETALPLALPGSSVPVVPLTWAITRAPAHGTLTGTAPELIYQPAAGYTGTDSFAYTLTGGAAVSKAGGIHIEVTPSAPDALDGMVSIPHNTATTLTLPASDPNEDPLTWTVVSAPPQGTLSGSGATLTYTPATGFSGTVTFTYKVNDGQRDSRVATMTLQVLPPPTAPTAVTISDNKVLTSDIAGSFLARLQAADANPSDTHTYQLVAGTGDIHNGFVQIQGNQLRATQNLASLTGQTLRLRIEVTDSSGQSIIQQVSLPVLEPVHSVVINEVHYNPARNAIPGEFVELYNATAQAVDLSGWSLDGGVKFTFPAGSSIAPSGYLVIAEDPATALGVYGVTALGPWEGNLNGDGEDLALRGPGGAVVDTLEYAPVSPWPSAANGDGPSLELIHPSLNNELGSNWKASKATPEASVWLPAASTGWKYRKGTNAQGEASNPVEAWRTPSFAEDATWLTGRTPIGTTLSTTVRSETGIAAINTVLTDMNASSYRSVNLRRSFTVAGVIPKTVLLRVLHNDAAIVWINGQEVTRLGIRAGEKAYNTTDYYETGNDPWSEIVLANADQLLVSGENLIAIQAFAKAPQLRSAQDDGAVYGVFDFAVDAELRNVPDTQPTPGAQNSVFQENAVAAPAVREVTHTPQQPTSAQSLVVTAKVTDPQGVQSVELLYQIVSPGNYIPALLPLSATQLLADPSAPRLANPAFEDPANWTTVPMSDSGGTGDSLAGDAVYQGTIPAQPHRTLIRYRIRVTDFGGTSATLPYTGDPARNWAAFSYDGVPAYTSGANTFSAERMTSVPVYHFLMRNPDLQTLVAYGSQDQMPNSISLNALRARRTENWAFTFVSDGVVYDHVNTRLRGGNSRYMGNAKRHLRINFNKGYPFAAKDEKGRPYPVKWDAMLVNKMFGNKGYYSWGLEQEIGGNLWRLNDVPVPEAHWFHMRMVRSAAEAPTSIAGDFYGVFQAIEFVDKRFLEARNMESGNVYKLSDWTQNGEMLDRYGAAGAPQFGEDLDNFRYNIHGAATQAFMETYVNMPAWYRYNAVQEAIRHYDIFTEPTGRHRMKNLILYFEPREGTNGLGRGLVMPYDWDASFGPSWNSGQDTVRNGIYNHNPVPDSPTWGPVVAKPAMAIAHRNAIREFRDLIWQPDQVNPMIDTAVETISSIWQADRARWPSTGATGDHVQGPVYKGQDMKNFAFTNWTDPFGVDPGVLGGRDNYLDSLANSGDSSQVPVRPTIQYRGDAGYPLTGLRFEASAFNDPQGAATFAGMEWRVGEITDPAAPSWSPGSDPVYEAETIWESGLLTTAQLQLNLPAGSLRSGHTYRARVRYLDTTGRYSNWSLPAEFTTTGPDILQTLRQNLIISEILYKPAPPTAAEAAAGYVEAEFEFLELQNLSASTALDLSNLRFTKGIDFDFAPGSLLPAGGRVLVVANPAAFQMRYGTGGSVAGGWREGQSLSNSGEQLLLNLGEAEAVRDFTYLDSQPWPPEADNAGTSMIYIGPQPVGDATEPQNSGSNWKASTTPGGTPGQAEGSGFQTWMALNGYADALADPDGDGYNHLAAFALALDLAAAPPSASLANPGVGSNHLRLTYTRRTASGLRFHHEQTSGAPGWVENGVSVVQVTPLAGGLESVTIQLDQAVSQSARAFLRVRIVAP